MTANQQQSPNADLSRAEDPFSTLCGFAAIGIWSTTVALARSVSEQIGPVSAGAVVYTLGGFVFVAVEWFRGHGSWSRMARLPRLYLAGCGSLFVFYTAAFFLALGWAADRNETVAVGLWNYLWPALTVLLSGPLLRVRLRWLVLPGTLLALTGVALVLTAGPAKSSSSLSIAWSANPAAFGLALAAAVAWALYSNLARRWAGAAGGGAVPLFVLASGLVLLVIRAVHAEPATWTLRTVAEVGCMGLTVVLSYAAWDRSMRRGNIRLVSACSYFTPLLSTLFSCLYLQVVPGLSLWLGSLLIVIGSLLSWRAVADT
jgi:drug/metabolite transporter (DMT)-like permease